MHDDTDLGRQEPRGCRHIYGDPASETWRFCQRTIKPGGRPGDPSHPPYCEWHTRQALQATTEAARRNYLKFLERVAEGDSGWSNSPEYAGFGGSAATTQAAHRAAESDNLVPVDVHVKIANRKGFSHG
jgi:hypothetical protein